MAQEKTKIKVVHIITLLELGGAQQNTLYTVANLPKDRYECILISGKGGILDEEAKRIKDVKIIFTPFLVRQINPFLDILAFFHVTLILFKEKPDIVHTHSSKAGILGRWVAWFTGVKKIIHTFHGFGFNDFQKPWTRTLFIWIERITALISDRLIVVSTENIKKGLENKLGCPEQYILIYSGIKIKEFQNNKFDVIEKKNQLGIKNNEPVVGMIACFKIQKEPCDFIRLAEKVHKEIPDVKFVLVGDGELRPEIERLIIEKELSGTVMLTGWRRDVLELYQIFDVFVITSLWEGLPRVLLEAFSSGKPVVATDVDGVREVIKDGENGFLVSVHDIDSMAKRVTILLKDSKKRGKMGEMGMKIISQKFDIDHMVMEQDSLYQELISSV